MPAQKFLMAFIVACSLCQFHESATADISIPNRPSISKKFPRGSKPEEQAPTKQPAATCDLGGISIENALIEGQSDNDPNRVALSIDLRFEPGPTTISNGVKRSSVIIKERMDVAFFRDWLAEGVSGLAAQVHENVPDTCSISRGRTDGIVVSRAPASFALVQGVTKRHCTSFDQPCGLPETTCSGGDAGAAPSCSLPSCNLSGCHGGGCSGGRLPTLPTCTTTTKMCRAEQKVDVFSTEVRLDYALDLAVSGAPPSQRIEVRNRATRNDISTSQGELTKFLSNIGLAGIFGVKVSDFERGASDYLSVTAASSTSSMQLFPIPTSDFVYLPVVRSNDGVRWWSPPGKKPIGLSIYRDMALPTSLACRVRKCFEQSKAAGKLLVSSCSL